MTKPNYNLESINHTELFHGLREIALNGHIALIVRDEAYSYDEENVEPPVITVIIEGEQIQDIQGELHDHLASEIQLMVDNLSKERDLIDQVIGQEICFCGAPVEQCFVASEQVRILTMPSEAPRPTGLIGVLHPFLLQFRYKPSSVHAVDDARRRQELLRWVRVLNIFLNRSVHDGGSGNQALHGSSREWGTPLPSYTKIAGQEMASSDNVNECMSIIMACRYYAGNIEHILASFSDRESNELLDMSAEDDQYFIGGTMHDMPLTLPASINHLLEALASLSEINRHKFHLASAWAYAAQQVHSGSRSAAFISYVSALESLLDKVDDYHIQHCSHCKQKNYQLTDRFINLLNEYGYSTIQLFGSLAENVYKLRSNLVHGDRLLLDDLSPWDEAIFSDEPLMVKLPGIVNDILRQWLLRTSTTNHVDDITMFK